MMTEKQLKLYITKIIKKEVPELKNVFDKNISIGKIKFNDKPYEIFLEKDKFIFIYYDWRNKTVYSFDNWFDLCFHLFDLLIYLYCENKYAHFNKEKVVEIKENLFAKLGNEYLIKFKTNQN